MALADGADEDAWAQRPMDSVEDINQLLIAPVLEDQHTGTEPFFQYPAPRPQKSGSIALPYRCRCGQPSPLGTTSVTTYAPVSSILATPVDRELRGWTN